MTFLALSQAPPPEVIEMATNRPVTITPISMAPSAAKALALSEMNRTATNSTIGDSTGSSDGTIISLIAALVRMSTARPYSGLTS
jgi:predicted ATPase